MKTLVQCSGAIKKGNQVFGITKMEQRNTTPCHHLISQSSQISQAACFLVPRAQDGTKKRAVTRNQGREHLSSTATYGRILYLKKGMAEKIIKWRYTKS